MTNIPVGITIAVVSSAAQSMGLVLQRMAHLNPSIKTHQNPIWHIGLILFLSSNLIGSSIQLTTLPILVLTPLQSIGLLFNSIFHSILLHEPFTKYSLIGSVYITLGSMGIAFTGNSLPDVDYSLEQFMVLLEKPIFIYWIILNLVIILTSTIISILISNDKWMSYIINKLDDWNEYWRLQLQSHQSEPIKCFIKLISLSSKYLNLMSMNNNLLIGLLIGSISGILSSYSILLAKSAIQILITNFFNLNSINSWKMYLIVLTFLILGGTQLILLNFSLKLLSTSILYPLVFSIFNIFSILNYLIFYNQFHCLNWLTSGLLISGTIFVIIGVSILSLQNNSSNTHNNHHCRLILDGDESISISSTATTPLIKKRCSVISTNHSMNISADLSGYVSFNSLNLDQDDPAGDGNIEVNYTNLLDDL